MTIKDITEWEVLTPDGWSDFSAIKQTNHDFVVKLTLSNGYELISSLSHRLLLKNNEFIEACSLNIGDVLYGDVLVNDIEIINEEHVLFDLLNVNLKSRYITNEVISHNCAHVMGMENLWTGLYPTLSTSGGKCILLSTPNGVGGLFHKVYTDAEAGLNDFNPICLPWEVHPEHDESWYLEQARQLGSRKRVNQELHCEFLSSGDTFLTIEDIEWVEKSITQPVEKWADDKSLWIWKYPMPEHRYLISADVARGDSADFSAFHVIDMTQSEIVAEYKGRKPPDQFADLLAETGIRYNKALLVPESNTFGYAVLMKLRDIGYPRVYKMNSKAVYIVEYSPISDDIGQMGFSTQGSNKIKILSKLEETIRNKLVKIYSSRLYEELKTFIWKGNKASALPGYNDDLVMSLAIGLWLFDVAEGHCNQDAILAKNIFDSMSVSSQKMESVGGPEIINPYHNQMKNHVPIMFGDDERIKKDPRFNYGDYSWVLK